MAISLYQATIPTFIQIAGATRQLLDKAESWCDEQGLAPAALIDARLIDDMWPFAFQIESVRTHTARALDALHTGRFSPPNDPLATDFAGLKRVVDEALSALAAVDEGMLESFEGKIVHFEAGDYKFDFDAPDFLLSFAQPNLMFHASTAYGILRAQGAPVGKLDFLGAIRIRPN